MLSGASCGAGVGGCDGWTKWCCCHCSLLMCMVMRCARLCTLHGLDLLCMHLWGGCFTQEELYCARYWDETMEESFADVSKPCQNRRKDWFVLNGINFIGNYSKCLVYISNCVDGAYDVIDERR